MSDVSILEDLQEVIADQLGRENIDLQMDTVASDVEGWDSLAHVRIMIAVEEHFGVRFQMSEITSMTDVGDLVRLIESKQSS